MGSKVSATNKKAFRDYYIFDRWECGIILSGPEVKSIRAGHVNFKDSFAKLENNEVFLYNLHINPYSQASDMNLKSDRTRKLLLHKKEISKMSGQVVQKHLSLVPTKLYFNKRGLVKIELALAKGKKFYDKREAIKKKDVERDLRRRLSQRSK